jgi:membrane-associated protease RseP (regulator of RpoE activity)
MRIGLSMVMMLFIFVTWNDLARLNVFDRVVSLFG